MTAYRNRRGTGVGQPWRQPWGTAFDGKPVGGVFASWVLFTLVVQHTRSARTRHSQDRSGQDFSIHGMALHGTAWHVHGGFVGIARKARSHFMTS